MTHSEVRAWTLRTALAALAFVAFVCLQTILPVTMLGVRGGHIGTDEAPRTGELPFSWQMYTVIPPPSGVVVVDRDGYRHELDVADALGVIGSRMAYDLDVLAMACASVPNSTEASIVIASAERTAQC